jgi:hypothetical protein
VGRQLQSALTNEVELVKHGELVTELVKLHQHDRRRESHRAHETRDRYPQVHASPFDRDRTSSTHFGDSS